MRIDVQQLDGVHLIHGEPVHDERGSFTRIFDEASLAASSIKTNYPQRALADNLRAGTLRGLHFTSLARAEAKLVSCIRGAIYDVVVDLRPTSRTRGNWRAFRLAATDYTTLYIPSGFAHGYQTLCDDTQVSYDLSTCFSPADARGVRYDDPELAIDWPLPVSMISPRDHDLPSFRTAVEMLEE